MDTREPDETSFQLARIASDDQAEAELRDTADRVAKYFQTLVSVGIPAESAARMTELYNKQVVTRHFGYVVVRMTDEEYVDE